MTASNSDNLKHAVSHLENLQRKSARRTLSDKQQALFDEEMVRAFVTKLGESEAQARERIAEIRRTRETMFSRYENPIWLTHAAELSEKIEAALEKRGAPKGKKILFGTLGTGDVNGMALDFKNPEYHIIVLDDGVFGYANLLTKAIVHTFPRIGKDEPPSFSTSLPAIQKRIEAEPMLFVRLADLILNYVVAGDPFVADQYYPELPYIPLTVGWLDAMECFIIGHEYGHSRLGHINGSATALIPHGAFSEVAVSWQQEFEADALGLEVMFDCTGDSPVAPAFRYAAIECFFAGLTLVQMTLARFDGAPYSDEGSESHPPIAERRLALREALKRHLDETERGRAITLAILVDQIIATMWPWLKEEIAKVMAEGRKPHAKWTSPEAA